MAIILNRRLEAEEHKDVSGLYEFISMLELELDNYISEPSAYLWYIRLENYEALCSNNSGNGTPKYFIKPYTTELECKQEGTKLMSLGKLESNTTMHFNCIQQSK